MAGDTTRMIELDALADEELVRVASSDGRAAFAVLYRRYVQRIYSIALRMLSHVEEAQDATQEVFLQAYRNLPKFQGRSGFYTWIYRVACNTCLQFRKRARRRREELLLQTACAKVEHGWLKPQRRATEQEAERHMLMEDVSGAIAELPETQRLALVLGPIQGHGYDEVARILGVTADVVKGRLHRARDNLRRLLDCDERAATAPASTAVVSTRARRSTCRTVSAW